MCIQRNDSVYVDFLDGTIAFVLLFYTVVLEASGGGGDYGDGVDAGDGDTGGDGGGHGGGDGGDIDPENQQMVIPLMAIRLTIAAMVIILQRNC